MWQYYRPDPPYFAGDCIPFSHDGVYHLYYLLDENHHQGLGGLGGHQWAHAATTDLIHWQHLPLALSIDTDWEKSICTGSVVHHDELFYAFYATRYADGFERLSCAISTDAIHFTKQAPNPLFNTPERYQGRDFRDPFVFHSPADNQFHMLVSARLHALDQYRRGGCLAHFSSTDLGKWTVQEPFIVPGYLGTPECPDYFEWNGWYYLVFSIAGVARYRLARQPFGPWQTPPIDTFDSSMARVMKTAAYGSGRRIGAAFLGTLKDNRDDGAEQYAGDIVFLEITQNTDGTLASMFVAEMQPPVTTPDLRMEALTPGATITNSTVSFSASQTYQEAVLHPIQQRTCLSFSFVVHSPTQRYGIAVRGTDTYAERYEIDFNPQEQRICVTGTRKTGVAAPVKYELRSVTGLMEGALVELILHDDIVDLCINKRRCMVLRLPELRGEKLYIFGHDGEISCQIS